MYAIIAETELICNEQLPSFLDRTKHIMIITGFNKLSIQRIAVRLLGDIHQMVMCISILNDFLNDNLCYHLEWIIS